MTAQLQARCQINGVNRTQTTVGLRRDYLIQALKEIRMAFRRSLVSFVVWECSER